MRRLLLLLLVPTVTLADPPPPPRQATSPPPPTAPLPVRQYNAWQSIQGPLSRSRGEDGDDDDLILRGYYAPAGRLPVEPMPDVLDSVAKPPPRPRLDSLKDEASRKAELDRREYELYLHTGLNDQTYAAASAADALDAAKAERDRDLLAAQEAYQEQLTQPHADHVAANRAFIEQSHAIQQQYQTKRLQILGDPPTTQPTR